MIEPRDRRGTLLFGGAILGLLLGGCGTSPSPPATTVAPSIAPTAVASPGGTAAATESPAALPTPAASGPATAACSAADLKVSHGLVEGTAGSRDTEVVLVTAARCVLPAWPTFGLRDAAGRGLVAGAPGGSGEAVIAPGGSYASEVQFSNWCGAEQTDPLTLVLQVGGESIAVTGGPFPEEGDMPPCTATGLPMLSGTAWALSS
jgi:hypothetical protein